MAVCSKCKAAITWVVTEGGKSMPIDSRPVADGNVVYDGTGPDRVRVLKKADQGDMFLAGRQRFVSHFATCKYANQFRKPREKKR